MTKIQNDKISNIVIIHSYGYLLLSFILYFYCNYNILYMLLSIFFIIPIFIQKYNNFNRNHMLFYSSPSAYFLIRWTYNNFFLYIFLSLIPIWLERDDTIFITLILFQLWLSTTLVGCYMPLSVFIASLIIQDIGLVLIWITLSIIALKPFPVSPLIWICVFFTLMTQHLLMSCSVTLFDNEINVLYRKGRTQRALDRLQYMFVDLSKCLLTAQSHNRGSDTEVDCSFRKINELVFFFEKIPQYMAGCLQFPRAATKNDQKPDMMNFEIREEDLSRLELLRRSVEDIVSTVKSMIQFREDAEPRRVTKSACEFHRYIRSLKTPCNIIPNIDFSTKKMRKRSTIGNIPWVITQRNSMAVDTAKNMWDELFHWKSSPLEWKSVSNCFTPRIKRPKDRSRSYDHARERSSTSHSRTNSDFSIHSRPAKDSETGIISESNSSILVFPRVQIEPVIQNAVCGEQLLGRWDTNPNAWMDLAGENKMIGCFVMSFLRDSNLTTNVSWLPLGSIIKLQHFCPTLQSSYSKLPYHNAVHAVDVANCCYSILKAEELSKTSPLLRFAAIIAALAHDVGHQGLDNGYMVKSRSNESYIWNDTSVLENMHAAILFSLIRKKHLDFTSSMDCDEYDAFRSACLHMILATDMGKHFDILRDFKSAFHYTEDADMTSRRAANGILNWDETLSCIGKKTLLRLNEDNTLMRLMLQMIIKVADLSHVAKPWHIHHSWSILITQELHGQGDIERQNGNSISPLYDRKKFKLAESQKGFIEHLCRPMYQSVFQLFEHPVYASVLAQLGDNENSWAKLSSINEQ
eukprot:GHVL01033783.1.p1 GENE.GHVL01033783.1~~GHVL01033783.1.p1  ORF type:complete len:915 (+),score=108.26 GHVL01033783.1:335-2746(+)